MGFTDRLFAQKNATYCRRDGGTFYNIHWKRLVDNTKLVLANRYFRCLGRHFVEYEKEKTVGICTVDGLMTLTFTFRDPQLSKWERWRSAVDLANWCRIELTYLV